MNGWDSFLYGSIYSTALLLSVLGVGFTAILPSIDRWSRRFFLTYFIVFQALGLSAYVDVFLYYNSAPRAVLYFMMFLEGLLLSLPLPMQTAYLLHCCGENLRSSRLLLPMLSFWAVSFIVTLASALFIGRFYDLTPDGLFQRGPLYWITVLPYIVIMLFNLAETLRRRRQLPRKIFLGLLIALIPVTVALIIHLFVEIYPLLDVSYVLSALVMYGFALFDQIEQDQRRQQEIAHQRASIMVLQMRPHFIYNTMMAIYYLCKQDPDLAQEVTLNFTTYLRKNFTAIASERPIPFSAELEHTRAYLSVEHARHKNRLFVDYDTPHVDFRLPPLTLQPIVENAVKHGMDPDSEPLHILIRTVRTDAGSEIIVENNGADFQSADDNDEPHIALKNIQHRLEMMCHGKMTITPRKGGGTVVKVTIPDA